MTTENQKENYKYKLTINQKASKKYNLDLHEALVISYFAVTDIEHNGLEQWCNTKILDSAGNYYCVRASKLIKELPLLGTNSRSSISRLYTSLVDKKALDIIVDENDSRNKFYRVTPNLKRIWHKKDQCVSNEQQCSLNETSVSNEQQGVSNEQQGVSNEQQGVSNEQPINKYNQENNKENNHNNQKEDEADSFSYSQNDSVYAKDIFANAIVSKYPKNISEIDQAKAWEIFSKNKELQTTKLIQLMKSIENYTNTVEVQNHIANANQQFIKNLATFLKEWDSFNSKLPENYTKIEKFEAQKNPNGAVCDTGDSHDNAINRYNQNLRDSFTPEQNTHFRELMKKVETIQQHLSTHDFTSDGEDYDDNWIKDILSEKEYEVFAFKMGWVKNIANGAIDSYAQTMMEKIYDFGEY